VKDFLTHLAHLAYLMLPAYAANMTPPFVRFWKGWNRPIHLASLGAHKTVVGFLSGVLMAVVATALQYAIDASFSLIDYSHWIWIGLGFGVGAMAGDSIKSYFKRRLGVAPGQPWVPFDQLDFVAGALLVVGPLARIDAGDIALILAMSLVGDIVVNRVAFRLGIKSSPW
jgi:CDP-2,3-bis-(O-geranylgeranyl)-sn-glycerol synthase